MAERNINSLRYADDTTLMAESEEELESLLMKVIEESEKVCLKLDNQKTKIIASGPMTSWKIDGEAVSDFILGGPKITVDGDRSHEIKRCLILGRKSMINLDGKEGRDGKLCGSSVNSAIAQRWNGCKRRKPPTLPGNRLLPPPPALSGPQCGQ